MPFELSWIPGGSVGFLINLFEFFELTMVVVRGREGIRRLLVTNLLIMCPSPERPIILKIQSQKKLRKGNRESIYRIRKAEHLSTHGGSGGVGGRS